ncbi:hypothetical protein XSR1_470009 [Xenorhabdus szentirmaii DSM 16338]|uniref:Uncharacterized protein n=1 Tax=Xenorhabdus szentirmaii DSM 16338 TaxID=1427518 RepID=W1J4V9_9GAMM|nr:hypothetical protein XSR1_470009 [Xenorhabdus szentirmaii DSM 16338]
MGNAILPEYTLILPRRPHQPKAPNNGDANKNDEIEVYIPIYYLYLSLYS